MHTCNNMNIQTHIQTCTHTHSKYILKPSKEQRNVPMFFLGISYLRIITFLHCWSILLFHASQAKQNSKYMDVKPLVYWVLLSSIGQQEMREPFDSYFYMTIADDFTDSVKSPGKGKSYEEKVAYSLYSFLLPLAQEIVFDEILTPSDHYCPQI